jgi:ankyrin repeat protein
MPPDFEEAVIKNKDTYILQQLRSDRPFPVNARNKNLQTGLMLACQHKSIQTLKVFLRKSTTFENDDPSLCNVNLVDASEWSALHYAAQSGSLESVQLLFNTRTYKTETELSFEIVNGMFRFFVEFEEESYFINSENETILQSAVENNLLSVVQSVMKKLFHVDATTNQNETAIFLATKHNHPDIVEFLAENNCHLQTKVFYSTPDYDASEDDRSNDEMLEDYLTPLEWAMRENFEETARCLLFHLKRTKELDEKELNKLLDKAVGQGQAKIVNDLIANGANLTPHGTLIFILPFLN